MGQKCRISREPTRQAPKEVRGLLLQQTAIFLYAAVPAARSHAHRLAGAAIRHTNRDVRAVEILFAGRDACGLLAAASHGNRECVLAAKQNEYGKHASEDPGIGAGIKIGHTNL